MISRPVWEQWHLNLHIKRPTSTFWLLFRLENDAHCYIFLLYQSLDEILKFNKLFCVVLLPLCWCTIQGQNALYSVELHLFMVDSKNKCLAIFRLQDSFLTQKLLVLYGTDIKKFLEPAMFCHLAVLICRGKVKDPRYMQNKKDSRISLDR